MTYTNTIAQQNTSLHYHSKYDWYWKTGIWGAIFFHHESSGGQTKHEYTRLVRVSAL